MSQKHFKLLTKFAREGGDIVPVRLGLKQAFLLNHPDYIAQVLSDRELFPKFIRKGRDLHDLIGEGLLNSEGDYWFHQRRKVQPIFHGKRIAAYGEVMVAYTESMLKTWQNGETRDVSTDMISLTLKIVMKTILNLEVSEEKAKNIAHCVDEGMHWVQSQRRLFFLKKEIREWFYIPKKIHYKKALQAMDETIYNIINQRRKNPLDTNDLLSMLMEIRDEADGGCMSDKQLRDEVATLILAGHETTASALSWTWMLLSQHSEVQAKLRAELQVVLCGRSPTVEDIPRLQYTEMVIKEAMRLYPPVPIITRRTSKDCKIGGYSVPAKCEILISQWTMHRNPRYFEEPDVFKPERWAGDLEKQLPKGVYFPFGDGPRICIAKGVARMEAVLLLATIAQKFQLTLVPNFSIVPQFSITLRPKNGIKVVLSKC